MNLRSASKKGRNHGDDDDDIVDKMVQIHAVLESSSSHVIEYKSDHLKKVHQMTIFELLDKEMKGCINNGVVNATCYSLGHVKQYSQNVDDNDNVAGDEDLFGSILTVEQLNHC